MIGPRAVSGVERKHLSVPQNYGLLAIGPRSNNGRKLNDDVRDDSALDRTIGLRRPENTWTTFAYRKTVNQP